MVSVPDCLSGGKGSIPFIVASRDIINRKIAGPIPRRLSVQVRLPLLKLLHLTFKKGNEDNAIYSNEKTI